MKIWKIPESSLLHLSAADIQPQNRDHASPSLPKQARCTSLNLVTALKGVGNDDPHFVLIVTLFDRISPHSMENNISSPIVI